MPTRVVLSFSLMIGFGATALAEDSRIAAHQSARDALIQKLTGATPHASRLMQPDDERSGVLTTTRTAAGGKRSELVSQRVTGSYETTRLTKSVVTTEGDKSSVSLRTQGHYGLEKLTISGDARGSVIRTSSNRGTNGYTTERTTRTALAMTPAKAGELVAAVPELFELPTNVLKGIFAGDLVLERNAMRQRGGSIKYPYDAKKANAYRLKVGNAEAKLDAGVYAKVKSALAK